MSRSRRAARTVALMSLFTMTDTQTDVPIASFDGDGSDLISLIADIDPIQDLHGYDNPWPSGGGAQLLNIVPQSGSVAGIDYSVDSDGYITLNGTAENGCNIYLAQNIPAINSKVTLSSNVFIPSGVYTGLVMLNTSTGLLELAPGLSQKTSGDDGVNQESRYRIYIASGSSFSNSKFRIMLNYGETALQWAPYSNLCPISGHTSADVIVSPTLNPSDGTTYPIPLGTTVYSATIDVVNGKVYARPYYPSYNGETLVGPWISSMDKYEEGATPTTGAQVVDMGGTVTEISLTPTQVTTLIGTNNIWADTGDIKYIEYNI